MTHAIQMMSVEQAKEYMDRNKPDTYVLLDVRQEWEYEEFHLPGARLLPLVELPDRMDEVGKDKPILVYCASGGRSMAAAALMEGHGYQGIKNVVGGARAWQGDVAYGPMELGLLEFTGQETPVEVLLKAYAMECRLQEFYVERADMAETLDRIEMFMELAGFEDKHKDVLYNLYVKVSGEDPGQAALEEQAKAGAGALVEGGLEIEEFVELYGDAFDDDQGILQVAAMVEAQALDYYLRCAMRVEEDETRDMLQLLAREEKAHLKLLGKFMDRRDS